MIYWLTSHNKKRHQRAINRLVRAINKNLENDELWCGRFMICQIDSPEWQAYEDGSGAELWVTLKFVDHATGRYYTTCDIVNNWRGPHANGFKINAIMNWLITTHWNVLQETIALERNFEDWRHYNATERKI